MKSAIKFTLPLFIILISCNSQNDKYKLVTDEFNKYLETEFEDFEKPNEAIYYIITSQSCRECLLLNSAMLLKHIDNPLIIPVLAGQSDNPTVKEIFLTLTQDYKTVLVDKNLNLKKYKLDFTKPLLIHQKNDNVILSKSVNDFDVNEADEYIMENS